MAHRRGSSVARQMTGDLVVDRDELNQGLSILRACLKRWRRRRARLTFEDGVLTIRLGHLTGGASASGQSRGEERITAEDLHWLATTLPDANPIRVEARSTHILVGGLMVPCQWSAP